MSMLAAIIAPMVILLSIARYAPRAVIAMPMINRDQRLMAVFVATQSDDRD